MSPGVVSGTRRPVSGASSDAGPSRPLLVTRDEQLLDDVIRLAALAGVELQVASDIVAARASWSEAAIVLVGSDLAADASLARLPRRRDVAMVLSGADHGGTLVTDDRPSAAAWKLAGDVGADAVVLLPEAESWLVRRFAEATVAPGAGKVVAVVPGSGGAGASVLSAALAMTALRQGVKPMLVDADPFGGGLDVLLGWEDRSGLRWPDLDDASGAVSVSSLYSALPRMGELVLLSWDRSDRHRVPPAAVDAVLDAGRRGSDVVVVDLPRWTDDSTVRVLQAADLTLLVVRPEVRGCAAARRLASVLVTHTSRIEVVVRGPAPGNLRAQDVSQALGLPLAGSLRPEAGLPAALDRGEAPAADGRGPLAALCRRLLTRLAITSEAVA